MTALANQLNRDRHPALADLTSARAERRTQTRFRVRIPLTVTPRARPEQLRATCQDISWGGVRFLLDQPLPASVHLVRVALPWRSDKTITADAHVQRTETAADGRTLVAARFVNLSPRSNSRLERLLKLLRKQSAETERSGPEQMVRELEVSANDALELTKMLEQIETGRYTATVFEAYKSNQSLCLSIAGTGTMDPVRLRARVEDVRKLDPAGFDWAHLHDVTLKFEHPTAALAAVGDYIRGRMQQSLEAADSSVFATPSTLVPSVGSGVGSSARRDSAGGERTPQRHAERLPPQRSNARGMLETEYPDSLNLLSAFWGDVEAFGQIFQDLLLGERSVPGGWPPEAWEELTMLQDIHDRAFGLSAQQKLFFR